MGARTYLPALGIFTTTDPIEGGNTTTYNYPQDPINGYDLDGTCWAWAQSLCDGFSNAIGWASENRVEIAHTTVGIAAGVGAGVGAGLFCGVTLGIGCAIIAGVLMGAALNVAGQTAVSVIFKERISVRRYIGWAFKGAINGGFGGAAKALPRQTVNFPAKAKVASYVASRAHQAWKSRYIGGHRWRGYLGRHRH